MLLLYDILVAIAVAAVLVPYHALRAIAGRGSWQVLRERMGKPGAVERGCVVIHGVSVGELAAAHGLRRVL